VSYTLSEDEGAQPNGWGGGRVTSCEWLSAPVHPLLASPIKGEGLARAWSLGLSRLT